MNHKNCRKLWKPRSFTLIELLTVIAIIGILAGILLPVVGRAREKAKQTQAKVEIKAIEGAIRQYYTEYGKLPVKDPSQGASDVWFDLGNQKEVMNTLRAIASGDNANNVLNPRRITFLETPSRKDAIGSDGTYRDPWYDASRLPNNIYYLKLDTNYNSLIEYWTGGQETISVIAIVISFGSKGSMCNPFDSACENIVSFRM